jgi:hypothetical protein
MRTLFFPALTVLTSVSLYALPPTDGVQWWTTDPNLDCTSFHSLIHEISLPSGGKGYACGVTGTFVWWAAGGDWSTSIRVAAPASGAIGVQYVFSDGDGNHLSLDTVAGSAPSTGDTVSMALRANQPSELQLRGASGDAPQYSTTRTGSVFALFFCPDAVTCASVSPQLLYSSLPVKPWSLSVPIAWDASYSVLQPSGLSRRWWTAGTNDTTNTISFALYNQSTQAATYMIRVYDSNGSLAAEAPTPVVPVGGTRGFLLAEIAKTGLPAGILKVAIEGDSRFSAVILQFNGDSATSLQATHDAVPDASGPVATTSPLK